MFNTYYEARDWLEGFIPQVYGREELGLERIRYLLKLLGNPEKKFKSIHVAGTSGKGSTAFYTSRLLMEKDYKAGLHISPHLTYIGERMQVNGKPISVGRLVRLVNEILPLVEVMRGSEVGLPSYFEILVAVSFVYFADEKVDFAVVEVGLGGRLDATNVLVPKVSIITNIGLDHTEILGNTLKKIAFEKAGIIKAGMPTITATNDKKALFVIKKVSEKVGSKLYIFNPQKIANSLLDQSNSGSIFLAKKALEVLKIDVNDRQIKKVAKEVFPGRVEKLDDFVVLDGAHNPDKIKFLVDFVRELKAKEVILVVAFKKDKNWKKMLDHLVGNLPIGKIIVTKYQAVTDTGKGSAVKMEEISRYIRPKWKFKVEGIENSQEAVVQAIGSRSAEELVLVTGSLYLVGEVRTIWKLPDF